MFDRKRKYLKGEKLTAIDAIKEIMAGRYVIEGDKPMHPSFMISRQIRDISNRAKMGRLFKAIENEDHQ